MPELRDHYGDDNLAMILGVRRAVLSFKHQLQPVARLAYMLHRATFQPGDPLTTLEIICLGKYGTRPQGKMRQIKQFSEKSTKLFTCEERDEQQRLAKL